MSGCSWDVLEVRGLQVTPAIRNHYSHHRMTCRINIPVETKYGSTDSDTTWGPFHADDSAFPCSSLEVRASTIRLEVSQFRWRYERERTRSKCLNGPQPAKTEPRALVYSEARLILPVRNLKLTTTVYSSLYSHRLLRANLGQIKPHLGLFESIGEQ